MEQEIEQIIEQPKENQEGEKQILSEGISAMRSLAREAYAISTKERSKEFLLEEQVILLEKDYIETKECIIYDGKVFELYAERKQTGYCAMHISSIIEDLKERGKQVLVIDLPRNRRKIFASI